MPASIISLILAAIISLVIGLLLQSPAEPPKLTTPSAVINHNDEATALSAKPGTAGINTLAQRLQQEIVARKNLQARIDELDKKIALLEKQSNPTTATNTAASLHATATSNTWFNQQALINAGMNAADAQQLKERFEKQELATLYLRDQALREGWLGSRRYREELQKLQAQTGNLKQELDEKTYAAYLFASGQPNRVTVQSVLASSAADNAGMKTGDQILRYDTQRIYNWRDLRNATTQGDINQTVAVEIIRNDKPVTIYVQRGPLGIRMDSLSIAP